MGQEEGRKEALGAVAQSESPPRRNLKLLAAGVDLYPKSLQLGHLFVGMGMEAVQGLVPIIRWGLERLLRVERKL